MTTQKNTEIPSYTRHPSYICSSCQSDEIFIYNIYTDKSLSLLCLECGNHANSHSDSFMSDSPKPQLVIDLHDEIPF